MLVPALTVAMLSLNTTRINFDHDWKFALGHAQDPAKDFDFSAGSFSAFAKSGTNNGPISLGFNDLAWRDIDLPHDWAIELPFDEKADLMHGYKPIGRSYPENSIGWYRKHFVVPTELASKRTRITFDGIFRDAHVFLNGHYLGRNESGYIGASFDLTDYLKYGEQNVVAVRVDASYMEGWFYEGAGIYRHTWLTSSEPVHFSEDGVFFNPVADKNPRIETSAEVSNFTDQSVTRTLTVTLKDSAGQVVATSKSKPVTIPPFSSHTVLVQTPVKTPHLWSPENPVLFVATATIESDEFSHRIGFRTVRFDPDEGLSINGKPYKIQGVCCHQDHAGVGVAVPDSVNRWRIKQLQNEVGANFYRSSHNPPTPELLDACDELGMMVLDEVRSFGSTGEYHSQLSRLIRRDRNHASVIFWSIGNEEWGTQNSPESARIATSMMQTVKQLDPTRLVTFAANNGAETKGINSVVDIRGFNYQLQGLEDYRKARPKQPIHGSETASTVTTRGEYIDDPAKGYKKAYDIQGVDWGSSAEAWWSLTEKYPWFMGGFVWTGFDYRGEPTPYSWPNISSHFGILDTCGFPKDVAYYYRSWWKTEPVLHLLPHWNWAGHEGKPIDVWVFSNHEEVELFLNGNSLGRQTLRKTGHLEWKVPYSPGELRAVAYAKGKSVQSTSIQTTGPASKLVLESDFSTLKPDRADAAVINVRAVDDRGHTVPLANNEITFEISGPAKILGVGNGDPSCHEPDTLVDGREFSAPGGWKLHRLEGSSKDLREIAATFDDSSWEPARVGEYTLFSPGSVAIYRASFEAASSGEFTHISVGPIDDLGWVYINGELVGTTNKWDQTYTFELVRPVKAGTNTIAIVVENQGGSGGLIGGATLLGAINIPVYKRSLFNGRAQVIVRSQDKSGQIVIKATAKGLEPAELKISAK